MSLTLRIVLVLFGLAYLISPVDIIPDLLVPVLGWLDDGLVLWSVYHLIRYGDLPWFLFRKHVKPGPHPPHWNKKARRQTPGASGPKTGQAQSPGDKKAGPDPRDSETDMPPTPQEILGVRPDATWSEIQQAYKEKIKQYHPDKLSHLGEEFSSLANQKFLKIQDAYNTLKTRHRKP